MEEQFSKIATKISVITVPLVLISGIVCATIRQQVIGEAEIYKDITWVCKPANLLDTDGDEVDDRNDWPFIKHSTYIKGTVVYAH